MARKTKEATALTRRQILDAARQVFATRGVSRTTIADIAAAAGTSRGAVYWHFQNKTDLFFAMRDDITLPLVDRIEDPALAPSQADPLGGIASYLHSVLDMVEQDAAARETFDIIASKCEYVDEFAAVHEQMMNRCRDLVRKLTAAYAAAQAQGLLREGLVAELLAFDTYVFFAGLVRLWLADRDGSVVRERTHALIDQHVAQRRR